MLDHSHSNRNERDQPWKVEINFLKDVKTPRAFLPTRLGSAAKEPQKNTTPGHIPHQEIPTQTILILNSHTGMITRPQDYIPISCVSHLLTKNQHYYHNVKNFRGSNLIRKIYGTYAARGKKRALSRLLSA
jgi:hypothetical protein